MLYIGIKFVNNIIFDKLQRHWFTHFDFYGDNFFGTKTFSQKNQIE